jgi:hypothetical protein
MKDDAVDPTASSQADQGDATEATASDRESSFSRRALLHAGWTVPVILTVAPPRAFAQSPGNHTDGVNHTDSHGDHTDAHSDRG